MVRDQLPLEDNAMKPEAVQADEESSTKAELRPELHFVTASCNRRPGSLSSLPSHSLAAYAAHNVAHIVCTKTIKVIAALPHHTASINAVNLIYHHSVHLFTASSNGMLGHSTLQADKTWHTVTAAAHKVSCVALDSIVTSTGQLLLVTVAADSVVSLWTMLPKLELLKSTSLSLSPNGRHVLPECVAIHSLRDESIIIAVGGTHPAIQLFHYTSPDLVFCAHLSGHRDWIRGLAFHSTDTQILLASASTDTTARVWSLSLNHSQPHTATLNVSLPLSTLSIFKRDLLDEHSAAVHTVSFSDTHHLVTASMDCSVAVWQTTPHTTCLTRFGLMGGQSAHALGFFGAVFTTSTPDHILAHNFSGALHRWQLSDSATTENRYISQPGITGHFAAVTDISWSPCGRFLLTCSLDKTTRIFAQHEGRFVEWARPQVHGHSLFALAFMHEKGASFVSGAEERMLRVFEAPSSFLLPGEQHGPSDARQALAAVIPQLGLSNKPLFADSSKTEKGDTEYSDAFSSFGAHRSKSPVPLEEDLSQYRLWPETGKLYGHGNEISCVAVDLQNNVLASACRAQTAKDAVIILWDIDKSIECAQLKAHELTVNQMSFSKDGNALLSVCKDRSFAVFERAESRFDFKLTVHRKIAHTRMPNCGTWLQDHHLVATGGRDKCVKVFSILDKNTGENGKELQKLKLDSAVTALDFVGTKEDNGILAVAHESGVIRLFSASWDNSKTTILKSLFKCGGNLQCGARIHALQWRPSCNTEQTQASELELAVSSEDCSVRVYSVPARLAETLS